jgi:hypothetical protein
MKLTNILRQLIVEGSDKPPRLVSSFTHENLPIKLIATYHQWHDRMAIESLNTIVDMYEENFNNNPKYYERLGVPNKLVKEIFFKNFEKIKGIFESEISKSNNSNIFIKYPKYENPKSNDTILFVKKVGESLDIVEYMDYAEFVLATDNLKEYRIITSAFSIDGMYLKGTTSKKNTLRVVL